jgi:type IV secretory pathway TraG/TraD family ATPase VirD4
MRRRAGLEQFTHTGKMRHIREHLPTYLGHAHSRYGSRLFGIKHDDRFHHVYAIGKTGTGKSTLLENMVLQDVRHGNGVALIDPHGDLVTRIAGAIPESRKQDVFFVNVPDPHQPYGYNPLRSVRPDRIPLAASGLLEAMKKVWADAWGVRMEHILRNAVFALLEQKDATLADILRLFSDKQYRKTIARSLKNETIRTFWEKEYEKYSFGYRADGIAAIQNKIGAFLADPTMKRVLTEPRHDLRIRKIMDEGQILLVNLAKGAIGEDSASLLGALLVTTIGLAAFSRADVPYAERRPFFVYIDEFQSFTTLALANMLSELRKYRVGITASHQYLHQLEPEIRHAVLGNAGTIISFRLGAGDAPYLSREFSNKFSPADLIALKNHRIALKLMINGMPSQPFSARTLEPYVSTP